MALKIETRIIRACKRLLLKDIDLFLMKGSERSICHRLALYMEPYFLAYNVDCEYDRDDSFKHKKIDLREFYEDDNDRRDVTPDIIVHKRGENEHNLVIIEAKKNDAYDAIPDRRDLEKLTSYIREYGYQYGIALQLITGNTADKCLVKIFLMISIDGEIQRSCIDVGFEEPSTVNVFYTNKYDWL